MGEEGEDAAYSGYLPSLDATLSSSGSGAGPELEPL